MQPSIESSSKYLQVNASLRDLTAQIWEQQHEGMWVLDDDPIGKGRPSGLTIHGEASNE